MRQIGKKLAFTACVLLTAAVCLFPAGKALAGTQTFYVPDETKPTPINFVNGSFEDPVVTLWHSNGTYFNYYRPGYVPGWASIPVSTSNYSNPNAYDIELQRVNTSGTSGFATTEAAGPQYAELNCAVPGRLYQVAATTPGSRLYWRFAHRAIGVKWNNSSSAGNDVLNFYLRPSGSPGTAPTSAQLIQTANDDSYSWHYYSGRYIVPSGQTSTEFTFQSVSSWTGHPENGNFLDDISFQTGSKLIAKKSITTSASGNATAMKGETVTITVVITNWGETDASRCVFRDILSDGLDYVAGSATINGSAAGSLATFNSSTDELRVNFGTGATAGTSSTNGGVLEGSRNTVHALDAGEGMNVTISYQALVTGNAGYVVKNQASVTYNDKGYEGYNANGFTAYSSVSGRTVSSSDETSYVNRFTITGGSISGRVWNDVNSNGTIDTGEARLSGLTVTAYYSADLSYSTPVATTTTSATGTYTFSGLKISPYTIVITTPSGYVVTRKANDNDAVPSGARAIIQGNGITTTTPTLTNRDFGFTASRTVSGRVWYDTDTDGTIDTGETRVSGLTVGIYAYTDTAYTTPLTNLYGTALTTTTTSTGTYSFSYVPYGTYDIVITTPSGYIVTRYASDNNAIPSGTKAVINNLAVTASVSNMDFGFTQNRTASGRVWLDSNTNGTYDGLTGTGGESPISGVTIGVYASTDTTYTTPISSIYGTSLTMTTGTNGTYSFSSIPYGTYKIVAITPSGYIVTIFANDNDAVPSGTRAVINSVNLTTATSATYKDFGFTIDRTITGRAWYDENAEGTIDATEQMTPGLPVGIYASTDTTYTTPVNSIYGAALTTTTGATGTFSFSNVPYGTYKIVATTPSGYAVTILANDNDASASGARAVIGSVALTTLTSVSDEDFGFVVNNTVTGRVWYDENEDGTIDSTETRISGTTVYICSTTNGTTPITDLFGNALTTTTDANGVYSFAYVPSGTYNIVVQRPGAQYVVTVLANDNDATLWGDNPRIQNVEFTMFTSISNMDCGFTVFRSINGLVWYDANTDGTADDDEYVVATSEGATIGVYDAADTTYTTPVNNLYGYPMETTIHSSSPGDDTVQNNAGSGSYSFTYLPHGIYQIVMTTPDGYMVTVLANDNDAVPSGTRAVIHDIDFTAFVQTDAYDMDIGFAEERTLGGRVWYDDNLNGTIDSGEAMASGVTVSLYASTDTTYSNPVTDMYGEELSVETDASGVYSLTRIPYGIYQVAIEIPSGCKVTVLANDNDAVENGDYAVIGGVDLISNIELSNEDFGLIYVYPLSLSKIVKGDLADKDEEFTFRFYFTGFTGQLAYTGESVILGIGAPADGTIADYGTVTLRHGQGITIQNIPAGTAYQIVEVDSNGYTVSVRDGNDSGVISEDTNVRFINTLGSITPTGVLLDTLPYIVILLLITGVVILSVLVKRNSRSRKYYAGRSNNRGR